MIPDEKLDIILDVLVKELYQNKNISVDKVKDFDAEELRKVGHIGSKGISADSVLELTSISEQIESIKDIEELKQIDLSVIDALLKKARERKIAQLIYRISVGNLHYGDEELTNSLKKLNIKIKTKKNRK